MATARVLCIIDTVGAGGGAEQLVAALIPEMKRQGADVEVAALFDWPEDLGAGMVREGVTLHRIHAPAGGISASSLMRLRGLIAGGDYNLFWGHLLMGNVHARLAQLWSRGSASVVTLHNQGIVGTPPSTLSGRMAVAAERRLLAGASMKVGVSAIVARDYAASFGWRDIEVAHNGIDVARLRALASGAGSAEVRRAFGIADDAFLIVNPARYIAMKGQSLLLQALTLLRGRGVPAHAVLCGTGPMEQALGAEAAQLGLGNAVTITGNLPQERLFPLLAAADAVALPSLREGFGIAAAEAMAIGTSTVLSAIDGFLELAGGSDGASIVPPGDATALAKALGDIHADPGRARAMAGRGATHVEARFGIVKCAARWIELLREVAARSG